MASLLAHRRLIPIGVGCVLLAQSVSAQRQPVSATCEGILVESNELSQKDADKYCRYASSERRKVEKYWGPTWHEPIRIQVSSAYAISRSLVTNG